MKEITRREAMLKVTYWSPLLSLFGIRFHAYVNPLAVGWEGWLTWCGRLVGFVRLNRSILWW